MYVSDEKALGYLGALLLVILPWLGINFSVWGLLWDLLIIGALFVTGRRHGVRRTVIFLAMGYIVALAYFKTEGMAYMSFVPWAGLWVLFGSAKQWPERKTMLWTLVTAGLLGVLPVLQTFVHSVTPDLIDQAVTALTQQYEDNGVLSALQQQGIGTDQVDTVLRRFLGFYFSILPAMTVVISCLEIGVVYLLIRKWFMPPDGDTRLYFSRWRLPWYTIWAVIGGLAAYLLGDQMGWHSLELVGINLVVICGAITLVLGIACYLFFLFSPKVPRFLKIATLIINLIYFIFTAFVLMLLGMFDLVFDFRHLSNGAKESK